MKFINYVLDVLKEIEENILGYFVDKFIGIDFSKRYVLGAIRLNDTIIHYETIKRRQFSKIVKKLNLNTTKMNTILDYGSGKGYILYLLYKTKKFNKIVGIEILEELCEISTNNFKTLGIKEEINIINSDARYYNKIDEFNYIFMFNPFPKEAMNYIVEIIKNSLNTCPRKLIIIYVNAVHDNLIMDTSLFIKKDIIKRVPSSYSETIIYETIKC